MQLGLPRSWGDNGREDLWLAPKTDTAVLRHVQLALGSIGKLDATVICGFVKLAKVPTPDNQFTLNNDQRDLDPGDLPLNASHE